MEVIYGPYPWYFIFSLGLGIILGAAYDLLRVSRLIIKTSDIIVNAEDILFLAASGVAAIVVAYVMNNGQIRIYGLLSTVLGFAVYRWTLGMRAVKLIVLLYELISKCIKRVFRALIIPLRVVVAAIGKPIFVTARICMKRASGKMLKSIKKGTE